MQAFFLINRCLTRSTRLSRATPVYVYQHTSKDGGSYKLLQGPILNTESTLSSPGPRFGWSVAISDNAKVLVVGTDRAGNHAGLQTGIAYIYRKTHKGYVMSQRLQPTELTERAAFGYKVRNLSDRTKILDIAIRLSWSHSLLPFRIPGDHLRERQGRGRCYQKARHRRLE